MSAVTVPPIDLQGLFNAVAVAINAVIASFAQYVPMIVSVGVGISVALLFVKYGRRVIGRLTGMITGLFE